MVEEFNQLRVEYRATVLELRILGPSWAVRGAEAIEVWGQKFTELNMQLQAGVSAPLVKRANKDIPEMDRAVDDFVAELSQRYNPDARDLPARPDFDTLQDPQHPN